MSDSAIRLSGEYFSGDQPIGIAASLELSGARVQLQYADRLESFAATGLQISPRIGRSPRFILLPSGGQFLCADDPILDALPQESQAEGAAAWLERRWAMALAGIAIVVSLVLAGYFIGLPAAAKRVAAQIPLTTELELGNHALRWLDDNGWFQPTEVDEATQLFIREGFDELRSGLTTSAHLRLEFRAGPLGPNAFALPGGIIVVTDGMVHLTDSLEELLTVLAHEIGHVELRHTMRHVLQDSVIGVVAATLTADAATLSAAVVGLPALLAQTRYSREFESEADEFAFILIRRHGYSPAAFADLMERLAGEQGEFERSFSFVATHPLTSERIARARAAADHPPTGAIEKPAE